MNSFGFGGANAHIILQDAASYLAIHGLKGQHSTVHQPMNPSSSSNHSSSGCESGYVSDEAVEPFFEQAPEKLFLLSSNDQEGVKRNAQRLQPYLATDSALTPLFTDNLAYTLSSKRTMLPWKSYAVASSVSDLKLKLENTPAAIRSSSSAATRVAFVFTGQVSFFT